MRSFVWLEVWGKTPMDLGLPREQLDPGWEEAMLVIKAGLEEARELAKPI